MFHENCFILCKYEKQKSIAAAFRSCTDLGNFDIEEMCLGTIFGDDYFWLWKYMKKDVCPWLITSCTAKLISDLYLKAWMRFQKVN